MPVVKFIKRLDLKQNISFMDRHYLIAAVQQYSQFLIRLVSHTLKQNISFMDRHYLIAAVQQYSQFLIRLVSHTSRMLTILIMDWGCLINSCKV
jgi:hypothetical protein